MRQLQKGDQEPRQRDHRRIRLASVLILRTLRKANRRVPEETQASSAQDDRIATPTYSSRMDHDCGAFFFAAFFPIVESTPPAQALQISKAGILGRQMFLHVPPAFHLIGRGTTLTSVRVRGESTSLIIHRIWAEQ